MTRLFVYGSLMSGEPNHRFLARARFVRVARTEPRFTLLDLGAYPALRAEGRTSVRGEIYEVDAVTLAAVDRLEGHPSYFRRSPIELRNGEFVEAYVLPFDGAKRYATVDCGNWRNRCESK